MILTTRKFHLVAVWLIIITLMIACTNEEPSVNTEALAVADETATPAPSNTPRATFTPSATPAPTDTPTPEPSATPTNTATPTPTATITPSPTATPTPTPHIQQLTTGNCCVDPYWTADSQSIRFIDQAPNTGQTGIFSLDITNPAEGPQFVTDRLGYTSPNGRYFVYPDRINGLAVFEDTETGESWSLDLNESAPNFTPDGEGLFWTESDRDTPFEFRVSTFWTSDIKGENRRQIAQMRRASASRWLDDTHLLMSTSDQYDPDRDPEIINTIYSRFSIEDGTMTELFRTERPRGMAFNPSQTRLVYYTVLARNPENNGTWYIDLTEEPPYTPQPLPILGSYQWQDDDTLIYIPFDPDAESHFFYSYDFNTGESKQLTDESQPLITIANNDWRISPDGTKIVLVASKDRQLDGLWLVELGQ